MRRGDCCGRIRPALARLTDHRSIPGRACRRLPLNSLLETKSASDIDYLTFIIGDLPQAHLIWSAHDAALSDNRRDVTIRRHVKRRIRHVNAFRSEMYALHMRDFPRGAFLNRNLVSGSKRQIES